MKRKSKWQLAGQAAVEAAHDVRRQLRCPNKELVTLAITAAIMIGYCVALYDARYNMLTGADRWISARKVQDM